MNIGIFLGHYYQDLGGNFTFQQSLVSSLDSVKTAHVFYIFYYGDMNVGLEIKSNIKLVKLNKRSLVHIKNKTFSKALNFIGKKTKYSLLSKTAEACNIDIMWFVSHSFELVDIPYICTVLDLEHRIHPFFPEVSVTGNTWENRETLFETMIPRAAYVISGTEAGKEEVLKYYHPQEDCVRVIPFPVPPSIVQFLNESDDALPAELKDKPYLFYPAQFWPHKNHIVLLHALKLMLDTHGLQLHIVFCGSDKGNLAYIVETAETLGLKEHVDFLGFVSTQELFCLYKNAFALIYPSLFGPDNLPPLEAFAVGCPVIASKLSGSGEQLGDAALIVDPLNEEDIASAVVKLHKNPDLRQNLIAKGKERVKQLTPLAYISEIVAICDEFELYRRCWSRQEKYIHL